MLQERKKIFKNKAFKLGPFYLYNIPNFEHRDDVKNDLYIIGKYGRQISSTYVHYNADSTDIIWGNLYFYLYMIHYK